MFAFGKAPWNLHYLQSFTEIETNYLKVQNANFMVKICILSQTFHFMPGH